MTESLTIGGVSGNPGTLPVPLVPVPENVALYQTLHLGQESLRKQNHGLLSRHRWFERIRGCRKILEVGCGNGMLCQWLSHEFHSDVTGVDLVPGPYDRRDKGYTFALCDVMKDPLPRGFDAALSFDVLEHMETDKVPYVLKNIASTAPILVFTIAGYGYTIDHVTVQSPGWWLDMIEEHTEPRRWTVEVFTRYETRPSPVYVFTGSPC